MRIEAKEHDIQKSVVRLLRMTGAVVIGADVMDGLKFVANYTDQRRFAFIKHHKEMGWTKGQPDLIFIRDGHVFFVEMKNGTGRQSPEQKEFQRQIEDAGQEYLVWRSLADAVNWLNERRRQSAGTEPSFNLSDSGSLPPVPSMNLKG